MVYKKALLLLCMLAFLVSCGPKKINYGLEQDEPRIHLQKAALFLQEQKCQEAANEYQFYLAKKKDNPEAYNYLGLAYLCLKNYSSAKTNFEKALTLDSLYVEVHNNLGILYLEMNEFDRAEKEFLEYLNHKTANPAAVYYNLATLYFKKGDYETALFTTKRCVQVQPEAEAPRILYATILEQMGRNDEAIVEYKSMLDGNPNSQSANFNLGNLLIKYNKACEAKFHFSRVLEANPTNELGINASEKIKQIKCSEEFPIRPLPPPTKE
ncbi:MAG: hypothetical protein A2Y62_18720 [Candidatus Fischerbacteria bacterium RBG_13_37_8]|uniref:Uncharacterized protein n=1 Tax=Candidatus Fischerbacteria bacterium RBG_13_37_8 TaxID=1817863 RepID=A0A1F5VQ45_9BACT|nr:MAG: hypothetical protein A2Y62_18720 [Candidatus Fischerbacteria bacterium RBG_13_37_8]